MSQELPEQEVPSPDQEPETLAIEEMKPVFTISILKGLKQSLFELNQYNEMKLLP